MLRKKLRSVLMGGASAVLALTISSGMANAAATLKTLSTNYTLVNLGSAVANVSVSYYREDGTNWVADAGSTSFTVAASGGQKQIRQYFDATMTSGRGSAVVASDQPLGAVVQILARSPQVPTQGAYIGSSATATTYYVPLVMRNRASASGTTSSQIMVQNAGTSSVTVSIQLIAAAGFSNYTANNIQIAAGATKYYDLTEELASNVPDNWFGSAVVTSTGGAISVISNLFAGTNQLQTFNAFKPTDLTTKWFIPLFASRLTNLLSTPVAVQNLSGATMAVGDVDMVCTPNPTRTGLSPFTVSNTADIPNNSSYFFNPVIAGSSGTPDDWNGSCVLTATGNTAVFVQMRQPGRNEFAAAYEAINGSGTDRTVLVPLVAKIVGSTGFATPVSIQNLGAADTTVTITYTPSATECVGCQTFTETNVVIPANSAIDRNFRSTSTVPAMPSGWIGTMTVVSASQPIGGFVQLTSLNNTSGDTLMAHGVFTSP